MRHLIVVDKKTGKKKHVNVPSWEDGYFINANSTYADVAYSLLPLLYLDVGRIDSYNMGNTWKNIASGSAPSLYNALLTGSGGTSASFVNTNAGILNFASASSQYAIVSNDLGSLNNFTAIVWANLATAPAPGTSAIITNRYNGTNGVNFAIGSTTSSNSNIYGGFYTASVGWITAGGFAPAANTWYNYAVTYDQKQVKFYVNGVLNASVSSSYSASSSGLGLNIAKRWDASGTADFITGSVPVAIVYNKALTDRNIFDIYGQFKSRYLP
jgi:Concanavalin A-like lectin/glucanases superfamily